jgi:hypothetical protein
VAAVAVDPSERGTSRWMIPAGIAVGGEGLEPPTSSV